MPVVARRLDPSELTISAQNYNTNTDPDQAIDTLVSPTHKWFDIGEDLQGPLHMLPVDLSTVSLGVWSSEFSDGSGNFASPLTLQLSFSARTVTNVFIDFDDKAINYGTLLRVRYFDSLDNELLNQTIENSVMHFVFSSGAVEDVAKVEVQVLELNKVGARAKVLEFNVGVIDPWALMISPTRIIKSKVEITYLTPFQQELPIAINVPDTSSAVDVNQIANGVLIPDRRWFDIGTLNIGSGFSFLPVDPTTKEIGWWSDTKSNSLGEFDVPPVATLDYTLNTTLAIQVVGDERANIFPVDFTIKAFEGATEVYSKTVTGNTLVNWIDDLNNTSFQSDKIELTINKINKANVRARIIEFGTSSKDIFTDEQIVDIDYLEELYYTDGNIPIGAVSADEVVVRLKDEQHRFDVQNPNSPIAQELKRNRKLEVWFGAEISPGNTEWFKLKTFYTNNWKINREENIAQITGRDLLELLRTDEYKANIQMNVTLYDAFESILIDLGLTTQEYHIDSSFSSITLPYLWFEKGSSRKALTRLALNSLANITVDRDDRIIIEDTQPTAEVQFEFLDSENVFAVDYPLAFSEQVNQVKLSYYSYIFGTLKEVFKDTTLVTIPASTTIQREFEYSLFPIRDDITLTLTADTGITYTIIETYSWGCLVEFENTDVVDLDITQVKIDGYQLEKESTGISTAKDDDAITDAGLISQSIESMDLVQSQSYANTLSAELLNRFGLQEQDIEVDNRGHVALLPGSRVKINAKEYMLIGQELHYNGGLESIVHGKIIQGG